MENQQNRFSIWLIDGIARFVFWFFAAISAIVFVIVFLHLFKLLPVELNYDVELPVNFKVIEEGTFSQGHNVSKITISGATGKINFSDAPRGLTIFISVFIVPLIASVLYMLWLFKSFTTNVKLGKVFDSANIRHLKRIAYILVATWLYMQIGVAYYNLFIVKKFIFVGIEFGLGLGSSGNLLLFALFLWVLSHIFEKGAAIEEENRLTV